MMKNTSAFVCFWNFEGYVCHYKVQAEISTWMAFFFLSLNLASFARFFRLYVISMLIQY